MINVFKSRTNWTIIVSVALTTVQMAEGFLSPEIFVLLQSILGALAIYFRTVPSQKAE